MAADTMPVWIRTGLSTRRAHCRHRAHATTDVYATSSLAARASQQVPTIMRVTT
jgi:hypothetical protein